MFKNFCFIVAISFVLIGGYNISFADDIVCPENDASALKKGDKTAESAIASEKVVEKTKEVDNSLFSGKVRFRQQFEDSEGGAKKPRWRTRIRADINFLKELTDFNIGFTLRTGNGISGSSGSYSSGDSGNVDATVMSNLGIFVNQAFIAYKSSDSFWWVAGRYNNSVAKGMGASIFTTEMSFDSLYGFDGMGIFAKPVSDVLFYFGVTPFLETKRATPNDYVYTVLASTQLSYSGKLADNKFQVGAGFWGFLHPENLPEIETGFGYGRKASPAGDDEYLNTLEFFATYSIGGIALKFHMFYNIGATDDPLAALLHIGYGKTKEAGDVCLALQLMYIERYSYYYKFIEFGVNFRGFQLSVKYTLAKNYTICLKLIGQNKIIAGSDLTGKATIKLDFEAKFK